MELEAIIGLSVPMDNKLVDGEMLALQARTVSTPSLAQARSGTWNPWTDIHLAPRTLLVLAGV